MRRNDMAITVKTNNVPRSILNSWDLTLSERAEFDYLDWDALEAGNDSRSFVRYRGRLYDLSDCDGNPPPGTPGRWARYISEDFCGGIVLRWVNPEDDDEGIVVGSLFA
jgi:hypothetical protein